MVAKKPEIAIFGASGLIGHYLTEWLMAEGYSVRPIARRFTPAQKSAFGTSAIEQDFAHSDPETLGILLNEADAEIILNCVGVLHDGPSGRTKETHEGFVTHLTEALSSGKPRLLVHISIPGQASRDKTTFSRSKRAAEEVIAGSGIPYLILRPGFVIAPNAFGGSALIRGLAALPLDLPAREAQAPFRTTAASDIARTVAWLAEQWAGGKQDTRSTWEVMSGDETTVGEVIAGFRGRFGGPERRLPIPSWLLNTGAKAGGLASWLGWAPPIRSTALAEMRRGVTGDPGPWMTATGIAPRNLVTALAAVPVTVQEKWFGRLYLLKGVLIPMLAVFWLLSGLIALFAAFEPAKAILTSHGFPDGLARTITIVSSLADIAIGLLISVRRTTAAGLIAGILVSFFYLLGAAIMTPDLWIEPLGALVKTVPAIVLMLVGLAILDNR